MVHSEHEDPLESFFEIILHDVIHHLLARLIQTSSVVVYHILKVINPIGQNLENHSNFFFQIFEFLVVQMHYLVVCKDLKHLFIQILRYCVHKKDSSCVGIAVTT